MAKLLRYTVTSENKDSRYVTRNYSGRSGEDAQAAYDHAVAQGSNVQWNAHFSDGHITTVKRHRSFENPLVGAVMNPLAALENTFMENPTGGETFGLVLLGLVAGGVGGYFLQPSISKMLTPASTPVGTQPTGTGSVLTAIAGAKAWWPQFQMPADPTKAWSASEMLGYLIRIGVFPAGSTTRLGLSAASVFGNAGLPGGRGGAGWQRLSAAMRQVYGFWAGNTGRMWPNGSAGQVLTGLMQRSGPLVALRPQL